jgi:hypothetical protein
MEESEEGYDVQEALCNGRTVALSRGKLSAGGCVHVPRKPNDLQVLHLAVFETLTAVA